MGPSRGAAAMSPGSWIGHYGPTALDASPASERVSGDTAEPARHFTG
jgi:hypothetical protein